MESTLADVRADLERPLGERPPDAPALEKRLHAACEELRASVADTGQEEPAVLADRLALLFEVCEQRERLRERDLLERLDVLAHIQESMHELRTCESPEELIEAAPRELCRACGFTRALISRVQDRAGSPR